MNELLEILYGVGAVGTGFALARHLAHRFRGAFARLREQEGAMRWLSIPAAIGVGSSFFLLAVMLLPLAAYAIQIFFGKRLTRQGDWLPTGAMLLALTEARVIFSLVLFAWSGLGAAFAPVLLCALLWDRTTLAGAVAGMLAGFATSIVWVLFFKEHTYELYEMIPGFIMGLMTTIIVSLQTQRRNRPR